MEVTVSTSWLPSRTGWPLMAYDGVAFFKAGLLAGPARSHLFDEDAFADALRSSGWRAHGPYRSG